MAKKKASGLRRPLTKASRATLEVLEILRGSNNREFKDILHAAVRTLEAAYGLMWAADELYQNRR